MLRPHMIDMAPQRIVSQPVVSQVKKTFKTVQESQSHVLDWIILIMFTDWKVLKFVKLCHIFILA